MKKSACFDRRKAFINIIYDNNIIYLFIIFTLSYDCVPIEFNFTETLSVHTFNAVDARVTGKLELTQS